MIPIEKTTTEGIEVGKMEISQEVKDYLKECEKLNVFQSIEDFVMAILVQRGCEFVCNTKKEVEDE